MSIAKVGSRARHIVESGIANKNSEVRVVEDARLHAMQMKGNYVRR